MLTAQYKVTMLIGSYVRIKDQPTIGQIVRIGKRKVWITVDALLFELPLQEIELIKDLPQSGILKKTLRSGGHQNNFAMLAPPSKMDSTLDLHGLNTMHALFMLDKFLDRALLIGHSPLRIIHGKGKGILRNAVRNYLRQHPLVKNIIEQSPMRCMAGITIVEL